jgi:DNA-binding YbaB/EbfC family protein
MKFRGGMSELMRQASRLQRKVAVRKEELKGTNVEASAGSDRVKVVVNGARELVSITLDPALLRDEEIGMVQDLIVAAVNAGMVKSAEMVDAEIEKVTGGVPIPGIG